MDSPYKIISSKTVYQGRIIEVIQEQVEVNGKIKTFEFARRSPGVRLIIISSDEKILLTKEYRKEIGDWDYRLPGGKVFDSLAEYKKFLTQNPDQTSLLQVAELAAIKEAREETGIDVKELKYLYTSQTGLTVHWDLYYFLVTKFEIHPDGQQLEEGEHIEEVLWLSKDEIKQMCVENKIQEDRSVAVLLKYLLT